MPRFNGINSDRLELFARKLLGIRQGGIMPALSPEPAISINLPQTPDFEALAGAIPFGGSAAAGAVAAQFSAVAFRNLSVNQLYIVQVQAGAAGAARKYAHRRYNSPLGGMVLVNPQNISWTDTRRGPESFPLGSVGLEVTSGNLGAVPPVPSWLVGSTMSAADTMSVGPWLILAPGEGYVVYDALPNQAADFFFRGWIRDILPDELNV